MHRPFCDGRLSSCSTKSNLIYNLGRWYYLLHLAIIYLLSILPAQHGQ